MAVQVIAEVGECFNGSMKRARKMISEAASAGCDVVKFQILDMEEVSKEDPEYDWFARIELNQEKILLLKKWAEEENIEILFTPVSVRTAGYLASLGISSVKIASSFIRKKELLEYVNRNFRTVYVSTGMAELEEIHHVVRLLERPERVILLHCISEYPTGPLLEQRGLKALEEQDAHLNMIQIMKHEFPDFTIGYSDHTSGIFVPVIAAAMGAQVIEKHFTLDRQQPINHYIQGKEYLGTDHVLSVEPKDLSEMTTLIRRVERCQGGMRWERTVGEKMLLDFLRGRYVEREK